MMRYYETLYIVDPNLENTVLDKTMTEIEQELVKTKSKIINHRVWDKKRLAYHILNHKYGSYIILQFEVGDQTKMRDFDVWMKLNNIVLRHMTVLLSDKPEIYKELINEVDNDQKEDSSSNNVEKPNNTEKDSDDKLDENKEEDTNGTSD